MGGYIDIAAPETIWSVGWTPAIIIFWQRNTIQPDEDRAEVADARLLMLATLQSKTGKVPYEGKCTNGDGKSISPSVG